MIDHNYARQHRGHCKKRSKIPKGQLHTLHPGAAFPAAVAAAIHCKGEIIRPAEGGDKQWNKNRHQRFCPLKKVARFQIRTCLLYTSPSPRDTR